MSTFGRIVRLVFWGCLEANFLILYLIFVFFPYMTIIAIRRVHIKNKVKRKMIRSGMPRDKAKIFAKKYKSFLVGYGSIKGIFRMTRKFTKAEKARDEESESKPELENSTNTGSISVG